MMTRRDFIKQSALFSSAFAVFPSFTTISQPLSEEDLSLHVFSKHLQFLDYKDMAEAAAELGFDGIDLTVRRKGHVLPERVEDDLPKAIEAIKAAGLLADMMASDVNNALDPLHRRVLRAAAAAGIKWYRLGYVSFNDQPIPERLAELNEQMKHLGRFNQMLGLTGAYQNHAGIRVGAAIWDIWHLLQGLEPDVMGCQYDIRHALVEGGTSWKTGLKLIRPKINSIVLKDFIWKKVDNSWKVFNVPLGEGMVDFDAYFKVLKAFDLDVPVSIHFEYDLGGAEHGAREVSAAQRKTIFEAMKRDVQFARTTWKNA